MWLLVFDPVSLTADLARDAGGALVHADTPERQLQTLVLGLLLTDRWAEAGDRLPDADAPRPSGDRRGWWGDALAETPGYRLGARLWLLARERADEPTRRRAIAYVEQALQPLLDQGLATAIEVDAAWAEGAGGRLDLRIVVRAPQDGPAAELALPIALADAA